MPNLCRILKSAFSAASSAAAGAALWSLSAAASAAEEGTAATFGSGIMDRTLASFVSAISTINLSYYATTLFWTLAGIALIWQFIQLMISARGEVSDVFAAFMRWLLFTGIAWLFVNPNPDSSVSLWSVFTTQFVSEVQKMPQLGGSAAGGISPSGIVDIGLNVVNAAWASLHFELSTSMLIGIANVGVSIGVFLLILSVAVEFLIMLVGLYVLIYVGVVCLGFAGSSWTKDFAFGYFKAVFMGALQLMGLMAIVYVAKQIFEFTNVDALKFVAQEEADPCEVWKFLLQALITGIAMKGLAVRVPQMLAGILSGNFSYAAGGAMNSAVGMAAGAAAMAFGMIGLTATAVAPVLGKGVEQIGRAVGSVGSGAEAFGLAAESGLGLGQAFRAAGAGFIEGWSAYANASGQSKSGAHSAAGSSSDAAGASEAHSDPCAASAAEGPQFAQGNAVSGVSGDESRQAPQGPQNPGDAGLPGSASGSELQGPKGEEGGQDLQGMPGEGQALRTGEGVSNAEAAPAAAPSPEGRSAEGMPSAPASESKREENFMRKSEFRMGEPVAVTPAPAPQEAGRADQTRAAVPEAQGASVSSLASGGDELASALRSAAEAAGYAGENAPNGAAWKPLGAFGPGQGSASASAALSSAADFNRTAIQENGGTQPGAGASGEAGEGGRGGAGGESGSAALSGDGAAVQSAAAPNADHADHPASGNADGGSAAAGPASTAKAAGEASKASAQMGASQAEANAQAGASAAASAAALSSRASAAAGDFISRIGLGGPLHRAAQASEGHSRPYQAAIPAIVALKTAGRIAAAAGRTAQKGKSLRGAAMSAGLLFGSGMNISRHSAM